MKSVTVITTGGTIASKHGPVVPGAVPSLKGEDFLAQLNLGRTDIAVSFEEYTNLPSSHITPMMALDLAQRVDSLLLSPDIDGIVITHGTDTLEETAYLLDLTISSPKPVVITGSMRTATAVGYDGIANLSGAIRVAASPDARDLGTLVVFNEEIHAASEVQKVHSLALNAFGSPATGPLGRVDGERVQILRRPTNRLYIPCARLEERVDLVITAQGLDDRPLRAAIEEGVAGVAIAALGSGRVPPWWLPTIQEAISKRIAVAITTRCLSGTCYDDYGYVGAYHDLRRLGVLFAQGLSPVKARIKLMVALGAARTPDELRNWFANSTN